ncbi:MAG TPA: hypothetical protein VE953_21390, partial [Terriglobales bacterium]|nr:hypothetical protein [Terriglobales bacterium]
MIAAERHRWSLSRRELAALVRRADRSLGTDAKTIERSEVRGQEPQPAALRALATVFEKRIEDLTELDREAHHGRGATPAEALDTERLAAALRAPRVVDRHRPCGGQGGGRVQPGSQPVEEDMLTFIGGDPVGMRTSIGRACGTVALGVISALVALARILWSGAIPV